MNNITFEQAREKFEMVQIKEEIEFIMSEVKKISPSIIVEIGVERGGSLAMWDSLLPHKNSLLIGIDINGNCMWDIDSGNAESSHYIVGDSSSKEVISMVKEILCGREIDFLYIDGDHTYEGSKADFDNYSPLVKESGLIGMHDVNMDLTGASGASKTWEEIKYRKQKIEKGIGSGLIWKS